MSGWHIRQGKGMINVAPEEGRPFTLPVDLDQPLDIERLCAVLNQLRQQAPVGLSAVVIEAEGPADRERVSLVLKELFGEHQHGVSAWRRQLVHAIRKVTHRDTPDVLTHVSPGLLAALFVLVVLVVMNIIAGDDTASAAAVDAPVAYSSPPDAIDRLLHDLSGHLRAEGTDQLQSFSLDWSPGGDVMASLRLAHSASRVMVLGRGAPSQDSGVERVTAAMTSWAGNPTLRAADGVLSVRLNSDRVSPGARQRSLDEKMLFDIAARHGVILNLQRAVSTDSFEVRLHAQPIRQVVRFADNVLAQGSWIRLEIQRSDGPPGLVSLAGRIPVAEPR